VGKNYEDNQAPEWKISSTEGTRDVIKVLMPLKGEKELPEEELKKFALDQNIIVFKRHAGKEGPEAKASKEDQLKAFRDSMPYYKTALEELEVYKNDLEKNRKDYGKLFSKENKDIALFQSISGKAQAICYFAGAVLKYTALMNGMTEDEAKEFISLWDKAGAIQKLFGGAVSQYNNICFMTPNQLLTEGYKEADNFKTYEQWLTGEIKASHEKRWKNAKHAAKAEAKKEAEKNKK
jgi:hypothetical protein